MFSCISKGAVASVYYIILSFLVSEELKTVVLRGDTVGS